MDRWKIDELKKIDDIDFAIAILDERKRKICAYSPLAIKISEAQRTLRGMKKGEQDNDTKA